jgi:predicted transcriptional regulator
MPKEKVYKDVDKTVYFNSITDELRRIGLTQEKTAELLGITRSGLIHRINQDKPSIHWQVYGLSQYFEYDNLDERDL